jgi:hypothetical protein
LLRDLKNIDNHFVPFKNIKHMSRPKIDEKDKRVVQVNIRLTEDESSTINEQAEASGLSPANWIRHKVFTGKFPPHKMSPLEAALYQELKKIGVNINQMTHKLHLGEQPHDYRTTQREIVELLDKICKALAHDSEPD